MIARSDKPWWFERRMLAFFGALLLLPLLVWLKADIEVQRTIASSIEWGLPALMGTFGAEHYARLRGHVGPAGPAGPAASQVASNAAAMDSIPPPSSRA